MSRGYYKTCGRKVSAPPPTQNIQFDALFCENRNKPSAAKSAGTLGKWGITSFTSIRSSSFTVGTNKKSEPVTYKRSRYDSKNNDSYSFSPPSPTAAVSPVQPKPKKFFKSRNAESDKPTKSATTPPAPKKPVKSTKAAFKRSVSPAQSFDEPEREPYISSVKESKEAEPSNSHNPPIVLRIFKGTAQLLTEETYLPKKEKEKDKDKDKDKEKECKRRVTHDSDEEYIPPKKHRHRTPKETPVEKPVSPVLDKELESLRNDLEDGMNEDIKPESEPVKPEVLEDTHLEEQLPVEESSVTANDTQENSQKILLPGTEIEMNVLTESEITNPHSPPPQNQLYEEEGGCEDEEEDEEEEKLADSGVYSNDDKVDEILDLSSNMKQPDHGEFNEEPDDVPLDLHVPHIPDKPVAVEPTFPHPPERLIDDLPPQKNEVESSDSDYSEPQERPSVVQAVKNEPVVPKLTLKPIKKGSIFKSRVGEKRNAHYIHKWSDKEEINKQNTSNTSVAQTKVIEGEFSENLTRITNYTKPDEFSEESEMFTSVTCSKTTKEFYTVVRNVKKAHQIQESGEFQEFNDDVEYILDALQDNNPIGTRCLSAITLASKCMVPAFRMHVRAHGTVQKFFKALHDASKDQSLGMCTATVMFVLSQDRLNMDLDRESLELMLSLLESDASSQALDDCGFTHVQLAKTKERVRSLCQEIKEQGHANHLNLDNITVGQLAMETLLSLTSKRAGEWFKEELRDLGGLEHIVRTIVDTASCVDPSVTLWDATLLERMRKLDRCLRVLENVTLNNEDNSNYLLAYGDGELVNTVLRVFMTCGSQILLYPVTSQKDKLSVGAVLRDCLVATLKILINITHDFNNKSSGSSLAGKKPGLIDSSLHVLFIVPDYVPEEQKFDLTFMCLMLLINLVEHSEANRQLLIEAQAPRNPEVLFENSRTAISALVSLFSQQEELARNVERKTDAILDGEEKPAEPSKSHEEYIEETVALLLQKAGRHMEYTFVAAYIATLLGYITMENEQRELFVRSHLPNQNFSKLVEVLQKFFNFMNLTASSGSASTRGIKATEMLIKHLTKLDQKIKTESEESVHDESKLFF